MAVISFLHVLRQGVAGVLRFAACVLSLPSAALSDIASLVWDDNDYER